ncbi:MAG TPA: hypothetical protein VL282_10930 [Tepidisphaeraceae bacterium]|jgi:hypothetical protein|nr:hypothetical protein [Tepidisphaeraceae bacterium]
MREWEVKVGRSWDDAAIAEVIESVATYMDLTIALKGTLRKYPGSVHWHFKKRRRLGTIELTISPEQKRVWLSVKSGRFFGWS